MAVIKKIKDSAGTVHDIVDVSCTIDGHYSPATADTNSELTAATSSTGDYAIDTEYSVVTGVKVQRDKKGHVVGVTCSKQKIKDTNTVFTHPDGTHVTGGNQTWSGNKAFNGSVSLNGNDLYLKPSSDTSNDSSDIVFTFGSGSEKSRIYMVDNPTSGVGPNYRVKNASGTTLYDGRLATLDDVSSNSYTHPTTAGNKHIPSGGSAGKILTYGGSSGTAQWADKTVDSSNLSSSDMDPVYILAAHNQSTSSSTCSNVNVYINPNDNSVHATKFYQQSDERLKTFTEDYDINLDDIKNIKTGKFYWKDDENQNINSGVTAQSIEEYFPELVSENENGIKSVNYDGLAVVAIAAIKKLTERIEQLEDIIRNK